MLTWGTSKVALVYKTYILYEVNHHIVIDSMPVARIPISALRVPDGKVAVTLSIHGLDAMSLVVDVGKWWRDRPGLQRRDYYRVELASGARLSMATVSRSRRR